MRAVTPGKSRQLTVVFLAVLVPAAVTLVWLGLRLLEQDRILFQQREVERREADADAIVRALSQLVLDAERRLAEGSPVIGGVLFTPDSGGMAVQPSSMVAWAPPARARNEIPSAVFASAEALEFQGNADRARTAYSDFARSPNVAVRAGALIRLARLKRQRGDAAGASAYYQRLAVIEGVQADGMPVDLLARRALCELLASKPAQAGLAQAVASLEADFTAGRWRLPRDAWELVAADLGRWTNRPIAATDDQRALSAAAEWFHGARPTPGNDRVLIPHETRRTLLVQRVVDGKSVAMAIAPSTLNGWLTSAAAQASVDHATVSLLDERELMAGRPAAQGEALVRRTPAETGLPWTVALAGGVVPAVSPEFQSRQRLFATGLGALGLLLAGGAYLLWRVVQREMAVARLQAEFVAAVSHEFRTPVTSLRHVIDLLHEDDDLPRDRRASFYDVLSRSTERLHRLVESLLDFTRMEDGRKPYDLRPLDPRALVTEVVRDFQTDAASHGYTVAVTIAPGAPEEIRADADALGHALWNLLDNAVKYSPKRDAISVEVAPHPTGIGIAVADEGIGVPREERSEIFQKFVRGEQASRLGIKGTGVGLAIVSHIVRAHGGTLELESDPGQGSTFRLVLPVPS